MVNKIICLFVFVLFIRCSVQNNNREKTNKVNGETTKVNKIDICDTIANNLLKFPENYTLEINNINSETKLRPIQIQSETFFEFRFLSKNIFDGYQLVFEGLRDSGRRIEPFAIDINVNDIEKINISGNKIASIYIKQFDLENICFKKTKQNGYDVLFSTNWRIKLRGKICDYYGPFSEGLSVNFKFNCE